MAVAEHLDTWRGPVRAAAEEGAAQEVASDDRSGRRDYRSMCRGTLAALDWLEGITDLAPCSHQRRCPGDPVTAPATGVVVTALDAEVGTAREWGSGYVRPPREDMHYFSAVWALLGWWEHPGDTVRKPAILVDGLTI